MFGPIYDRAIQKEHGGPKSMVGMIVQVFTNDDLMFEYQITKVLLHQLTLDAPLSATTEQLWLQTSEGPKGTPGKTQLVAQPLLVLPADHATANPTPAPGRLRLSDRGRTRRRAASDPVDPVEERGRADRDEDHEAGHEPEPVRLAAVERVAASLIPKIPATAPIPARITVTPVSRFMIRDRSLFTIET